MSSNTPLWSSRLAFFLSAMGAAVGLGSIWRFPYLVGTYGGAAFLLVFMIACALIAMPVLAAELLIGRAGRGSPPHAMEQLAADQGASRAWGWLGWLGAGTSFLVLSYYSVIAGWTLAYAWHSVLGTFIALDPAAVTAHFQSMLADPAALSFWHAVFMLLTALIVSSDLASGIERANKIMMPALFVLLLGLAIYALTVGEAERALDFIFRPDFAKLSWSGVLAAVGQAFFAIGVGLGMMMMYGAYLPRDVSLARSALIVAGSVMAVSLLAAIVIFPLVFHYGLDPAEGPQLVFITMPTAFAVMPGGALVGSAFFAVLVFAALTSAIAAMEPIAVRLHERCGWSRRRAALAAAITAWLLGLATVLSFNLWHEFHPLEGVPGFHGKTIFDSLSFITSDILPPLSATLIALFAGWVVGSDRLRREVALRGVAFFVWRWLLRWFCPVAIIGILLAGVL